MNYDEGYWQRRREEVCLEPEVAYLNSGSYSPLPKVVYDAISELRGRLSRQPSDFYWRQMPQLLDAARLRLAAFLNVSPSDLVLLRNATDGLNLAVTSLQLPAGSEVLMSDQEYGAMRFCWSRYAEAHGIRLREVPTPAVLDDPAQIVAAFRAAITPQTSAIFFSHVTSPTGTVLPAVQLCEMARSRGIVSMVDGAHAPGMIPLDLNEVGADFYAGNCHKWLMAPTGAAFLHVDPSKKEQMQPLVTSWGWEHDRAHADDDSGWGGSFWARNLEFQGTEDRCATLVLPTVFDFRDSLTAAAIFKRTADLADYARARISALGYAPQTPEGRRLSGSMTAFAFPSLDLVKARNWLWNRHRIEAPFTTAGGRTFLRVSTAWFNNRDEIDRLAEAIAQMPLGSLT